MGPAPALAPKFGLSFGSLSLFAPSLFTLGSRLDGPPHLRESRMLKPPTTFLKARACAIGIATSIAIVGAGAGVVIPMPAHAEPGLELRALNNRMERIERDLLDLQRELYKGSGAAETRVTAPGNAGPVSTSEATVRLGEIEDSLRRLTGRVEELSFQIEQTDRRLEMLSADIDFRFKELGQGGLPAGDAGLAPLASASPGDVPGAATVTTAQVATASAPRTLGTIPQDAAEALPVEDGAAPASTPEMTQFVSLSGLTPEESYGDAINMLKRGEFDAAEAAFSQFLIAHPKHNLSGNAQYWLGESHYVRGAYKDAADAFLKGYTTYADSPKAPDSLLKLGITLAALGQKDAACATLGELGRRFPEASQPVIQRAKLEQSKASCP